MENWTNGEACESEEAESTDKLENRWGGGGLLPPI